MTAGWAAQALCISPIKDVSVVRVRDMVCEAFGIKPSQLTLRRYVIARMICVYLARKISGMSYPKLAVAWGYHDHTTVMYGCKRIASLIESDPAIADIVHTLERDLEVEA